MPTIYWWRLLLQKLKLRLYVEVEKSLYIPPPSCHFLMSHLICLKYSREVGLYSTRVNPCIRQQRRNARQRGRDPCLRSPCALPVLCAAARCPPHALLVLGTHEPRLFSHNTLHISYPQHIATSSLPTAPRHPPSTAIRLAFELEVTPA